MRYPLCLLMGAIAAGCVSSTPVRGPDGSIGFYIECPRNQAQCMEEAAERCTYGYHVLDRGGQTGYVVSGAAVIPVHTGNMTVACRPRPTAAK